MFHDTFPIEAVADAVAAWLPGFRVDGNDLREVVEGDVVRYSLRCTRNEAIDDFEVVLTFGEKTSVVELKAEGRTAVRNVHMSPGEFLGTIPSEGIPMAVEELPTSFGEKPCQVLMVRSKVTLIVWECDGIAYRTIHDSGGYRLCFDLKGCSVL